LLSAPFDTLKHDQTTAFIVSGGCLSMPAILLHAMSTMIRRRDKFTMLLAAQDHRNIRLRQLVINTVIGMDWLGHLLQLVAAIFTGLSLYLLSSSLVPKPVIYGFVFIMAIGAGDMCVITVLEDVQKDWVRL
jgi:hypothetical protein